MKKKELIARIAQLETINDQLVTELQYIDMLVKQIGFENGLNTLKSAALEIIDEQENNEDDLEEPPYAM